MSNLYFDYIPIIIRSMNVNKRKTLQKINAVFPFNAMSCGSTLSRQTAWHFATETRKKKSSVNFLFQNTYQQYPVCMSEL